MKIQRDADRFHEIVRGKIRENLKKYVTHGEMIGRKGRDLVSIPVPQLGRAPFSLRTKRFGRCRAGRWRSKASRWDRGESADGAGAAGDAARCNTSWKSN